MPPPPYPDRIIIYLKAPTSNPAGGLQPAQINIVKATGGALVSVPGGSFLVGLKNVAQEEQIGFTASAPVGAFNVDWLAVGWSGGNCRSPLRAKLGACGDQDSSDLNIHYAPPMIPPNRVLSFTYFGTGVLTCRDNMGVLVSLDLAKDAQNGLCLTLSEDPAAAGNVAVTFVGNFLAPQSLP